MFSGGSSTGGSTNTSQQYFCYQCNRNVAITSPSASSELICPNCHGGFLEEIENPNPNSSHSDLNSNPNPFFSFSSDNLAPFPSFTGGSPFVFSTNLAGDDPTELTNIFSGGADRADEFNPFAFLQNYLNTLRASGANIQFVVDGNNNSTNLTGANLGDYFIGPGLEQLIQQLAENDPNRYGTPPAAKSAVEALPVVKISQEMLGCDFSECAVCKESFGLDEEARQMPCKHIYHSDCIMPWLEMHNSCPVCRFELPTDDPEYENRARDGSGGAGGLQENAETPRTMERRFRIQLPWQVMTSGKVVIAEMGMTMLADLTPVVKLGKKIWTSLLNREATTEWSRICTRLNIQRSLEYMKTMYTCTKQFYFRAYYLFVIAGCQSHLAPKSFFFFLVVEFCT